MYSYHHFICHFVSICLVVSTNPYRTCSTRSQLQMPLRGSDICSCRPYLLFAIEEAVKCAQRGGWTAEQLIPWKNHWEIIHISQATHGKHMGKSPLTGNYWELSIMYRSWSNHMGIQLNVIDTWCLVDDYFGVAKSTLNEIANLGIL